MPWNPLPADLGARLETKQASSSFSAGAIAVVKTVEIPTLAMGDFTCEWS